MVDNPKSAPVGAECDGARVVPRAVSLLREVSASRGNGTNLKSLAYAAGLPQPTPHRIPKALIDEGLLERDPATRTYRLGPLLYEFPPRVPPADRETPCCSLCGESRG